MAFSLGDMPAAPSKKKKVAKTPDEDLDALFSLEAPSEDEGEEGMGEEEMGEEEGMEEEEGSANLEEELADFSDEELQEELDRRMAAKPKKSVGKKAPAAFDNSDSDFY